MTSSPSSVTLPQPPAYTSSVAVRRLVSWTAFSAS